ncbi:threonine synthase [Leptospira sp. GIMC2001]|uniref:threonine synthase n=1 Tax=Leptospira sp. GIMC2001 TaxID=1513297 RepID=UPI00234A4BE6|nr:threonine synthase [Leptospira sp. GIMC2001]WCL49318.1 threonine synthase [Leptospira sp. GIMC2001]
MSVATSKFTAEFRCTHEGCGATYPLGEIIYTCKKDGELLEVSHDMEKLSSRSGADWKELFDARIGSYRFPFNSGIWSKREWVLPEIETQNIVSSGEGNTHLYDTGRFAKELGLDGLFVKQCGVSHTGSFKDLGMTVLVSQVNQMIADGKDIKAVACASTGDTSAALASYAAKAGIPSVIFLPANKVSAAQLIQPVSNGSLVLALDTDFDGCMNIVKQVTEKQGIYLANSMNSLRIEGQKTIAIEIVQQLGWEVPDWIVIPGGNLGNVSALGKGFEMMFDLGLIDRLPRICLAQAKNASPLYDAFLRDYSDFKPVTANKTLASAIQIGDPVSVKKAIKILKKFNGVVEIASEAELSDAAHRADRYGLYNCPHTGVALAATFKLIEAGTIRKKDKVVVISTAHGLKFTEFKVQYHNSQIPETDSRYINKIVECDANISKVLEILDKRL